MKKIISGLLVFIIFISSFSIGITNGYDNNIEKSIFHNVKM